MYEELEVHFSKDGLGRAAIVKRKDGLLQIFVHWLWNPSAREDFNVADNMPMTWSEYQGDPLDLYQEVEPEPALFGNLQDARSSILSRAEFSGLR